MKYGEALSRLTLGQSTSDEPADFSSRKTRRRRPHRDYTDWTPKRIKKALTDILKEADRINEEVQAQIEQIRIKYEDRFAKIVGMQTSFERHLHARRYLDSDVES